VAPTRTTSAGGKRAGTLYRAVQTAHGHAPAPRLYLMREIYVADSDKRARAEAHPYLLQYWELWNRYTQFTRGGRLPDSYDFWRRQAPMLHAMSFDEIVANDMVTHTTSLYSIEFGAAGTIQIQFMPIRPGAYAFYSPGFENKGLKGKIIVN